MVPEIELLGFTRKRFDVEAVQVTVENKHAVVELVGGYIFDDKKSNVIQVPVKRPQNKRQAQARVGDWVVYHEGTGWKVYPDASFQKTFERSNVNDLAGLAAHTAGGNS